MRMVADSTLSCQRRPTDVARARERPSRLACHTIVAVTRRSYAVVGVGAVGGYYGARLAAAGHPVHFLARSDADHLRTHGLRMESAGGDVLLETPSVFASPENLPPVDVVLVCLKTTDNAALATLLPPLVQRDMRRPPIVVILQNGLGIEEQIVPHVGAARLLGGLCFLCSNRIGPGHIRHLDYGRVSLGEHGQGGEPAGVTEAVDAVADDLAGATIPVVREPDLVVARWKKLVWNVPFNGLSVLLDALPQEVLASTPGRAMAITLMGEIQAGARACGREVDDGFVAQMLRDTETMTPYLTSMKLDFDAGRPLEVEAILRAPVRAAAGAGCDLPTVAFLADAVTHLAGLRPV